jgi:sulfur-carrier protein adenylyltransferase/sulfurtransferase
MISCRRTAQWERRWRKEATADGAGILKGMLTAAELARYGRQIVLPELGLAGQERLHGARVLVVGAGGLGSPAALYLAAAGVGTLGIVDDDIVEPSNLHRQVVHTTATIGAKKVASAADAITALNPNVKVVTFAERLDRQNARDIVSQFDIVVDGSDNYATRYAVNDACAESGIPWVYGSVERFSGQLSLFGAPDGKGPCYRCVFPQAPAPGESPSCEEIGVLGAVPGVIGSLQAVEALKWIAGIGAPLSGRLLQIDLRSMQFSEVRFSRRSDCEGCGTRRPEANDAADDVDIEPRELSERISAGSAPPLIDIREPWEVNINRIGNPRLLPMGEIQRAMSSLDPKAELILYCHHGTRSRMAADFLRARGFRARSLLGGIDRWSREVDPSIPRY